MSAREWEAAVSAHRYVEPLVRQSPRARPWRNYIVSLFIQDNEYKH